MDYKKYIELGFERIDMNCNVEFNRTGYSGFALEKSINENISVCVTSGDLDNPKLYIKKRFGETNHIIEITPEVVLDLFGTPINVDYMISAC